MTAYEKYSLVICLIVFLFLTIFFIVLISSLAKAQGKLIEHGAYDEEIIDEYLKKNKIGEKKGGVGSVLGALLGFIFLIIFIFALCLNFQKSSPFKNVPTLRVVQSSSMSKKIDSNDYLKKNNLNNQFDMYDIVLTYKLPDEFDLQLYDIVVYEVDKTLVIHRIVQIEEPNERHPDCRYFVLRGDSVQYNDRVPVLYEQMQGIYRGERVRFVGSFIAFMQSFAGWLSMGLVIFTLFFSPTLDKNLEKKRKERLLTLYPYADEPMMGEYLRWYLSTQRNG